MQSRIANRIDFLHGLTALFGKGTHIDVDFDEHVKRGKVFEGIKSDNAQYNGVDWRTC